MTVAQKKLVKEIDDMIASNENLTEKYDRVS